MRNTLRYFMWGFQPHFRSSLQLETERLLGAVGLQVKPLAMLIGFAASGEATWPICVEPEHRFFQPEHLQGTVGRASELYEAHPRSDLIHSDRRVHDIAHRHLRDQCRARAIGEALERESPNPVSYFAGGSVRVGHYEVHPVLGIPTHALESVPQLRTEELDDVPVTRSIVHGSIQVALASAVKALYEPDAGDSLRVLGATPEELAGRAAANLVTSAVRLTGSLTGDRLFSALGSVSTTRYEGESGFGSIIAAADTDSDLAVHVRLRRSISVSETRAVRKLLEISDRHRLGLLTNGTEIIGLAHVEPSYDPRHERIFEFHVVGEGQWLMRHAGIPLLEVRFGQPRLPTARIDEERFVDTATRVFTTSSKTDRDNLWQLTLAAAEQAHGTMLVVSEAAAEEAARLSAQAILIEPTVLSPKLLHQATSIDGAVLFDPDGTCHAIGVILDGTASADGDRSRGSRYNSAVRYLASAMERTMIVLVSEDGMIDVLPRLHPRIARETLDEAVDRYQRLTTAHEVDEELQADAFHRLEELAFYLSAEHCELINRLETEYQDRRLASGGIKIMGRPFKPDPALDDSYFL